MKNSVILFLMLMSLFLSCSKSNVENAAKPEVNIDSISVEQFDDIRVLVSMNAKGSNEIKKVGICWSKSPMPTITDSSRSLSSPYSTVINKIGENATYYFRAYIQIADKTIYSESKSISTGGLNVLIDKEYNNGRSRNIIDVKETADGSFIALITSSGIYSTYWPELILFNKSGDVVWNKEYAQYSSQSPVAVLEIEGGFLLATTDWTAVNFGHIFTKLDNNGNVLWEKKYGTKRNKDLMRILDNKNNSLIITLREYDDMKNGIRENCVITNYLIDLNGNLLSSTAYSADNGLAEGSPPYTFNDSNDLGYAAAYSWFNVNQSVVLYDITVKKISFDNRLLWEKKYGGAADEFVVQLTSSANKNWNLLGYSSSFGLTKPSAWLFQVDAQTGVIVWQAVYSNLKYGTSGVTHPRSLYEKSSDSYYISGNVANYYVTTSSAFIAKLRPSGQTSWEYTFDNAKYGNRAGVKIFVYGHDIYLFSIKTGPTPNSPSGIVFTKIQEI